MRCAQCQTESLADAAFCDGCGSPLEVACAACGTANRITARFCRSCGRALRATPTEVPGAHRTGKTPEEVDSRQSRADSPRSYTPRHLAEKILNNRSALEGERKQVTVLFVDVQGSMDLAGQVDAEEWHRIMDRFFAILSDGVHRYEGTINQYTGDGVMALFGAPIAHEDHARRACYAALHLAQQLRHYADELKRQQGLRFSVRMGMNSGEVIVGKIGDDLRMDYTAQGQTVGLAARMEQLADPGTAYLTAHTAALITGFFQLRDLGAFTVKGVREPLRVHELQGVGPLRTRLEVSRARGFSRFVGREAEIGVLEAALARAVEGHGHAVGVVADAGIGKSRLCYEFMQRCRARGIAVYEAHCVSHGKMIPFLPILEMLRGYFGVTEQDGAEETRRKVAGTLLLLEPDLTDDLPLLLDFLGVPDPQHPAPRIDPEARQRQLVTIAQRVMQVRSRREPAVLLIEDLHWIDGGSEGFLANLITALAGTRTLLLMNFRPEYHADWTAPAAGPDPSYQLVQLLPLGADAITELLRDVLGSDPSLNELGERIRARTGGNPFFIEELVRSLVDQGVLVRDPVTTMRLTRPLTEIQIPPTVHAVLAARIDRLAERDKQLLQTAAVIGKQCPEPVLLRVWAETTGDDAAAGGVAAALRELVAAEFLYEEAVFPEAVYGFTHPLTHEVAYRSQLAERRARVHAAVAAVIAALYADKLDERAALLAHHWQGAGNALEAARWSRRAAEWVRVSNLPEANRHWHQVRALLTQIPATVETTALALEACTQLLEVGWRLGIPAAEASALFAEGEGLAMRAGNPRSLAMLVNSYGVVRSHFGSADDFVESSMLARRLAEESDDAALQLTTRTRLVIALSAAGRLREALQLSEEVVTRPTDNPKLGTAVLGYSPYLRLIREHGKLLVDFGQLDAGVHDLERAERLARELGDLEVLGFAHREYVSVARIRGDTATALAHARETMRIADRLGSPFFRASACLAFGQAHILGTQWPEALGALEEALAIARAGQAGVETEALALAWLAGVHRGLGDLPRALAVADEALAAAVQRRTRLVQCIAHIARARVLLRLDAVGSSGEIGAGLAQALELIKETGAQSNEPFVRVELARLAAAAGDEVARQHELRSAHRLFTAMGAAPRALRVARELAA
ncbi:MAG TPA: adenylate/guanylate cyclase domain-containing protein [Candidatus Margulisiibacteriota bacterium]|nr:adenylate/guanylate cyclase domain-containing protein [Candidatus Margulisiibacteriota bacterium]